MIPQRKDDVVTRRDVLILGAGALLGSIDCAYTDTVLGRLALGFVLGAVFMLCWLLVIGVRRWITA